jgi:hypothetical protein
MTTQEKPEALFAKVRTLPEPRQLALVELLTEEILEEPYVLPDEERAIIEPALEEAKRGENLTNIENLNLRKPWARRFDSTAARNATWPRPVDRLRVARIMPGFEWESGKGRCEREVAQSYLQRSGTRVR